MFHPSAQTNKLIFSLRVSPWPQTNKLIFSLHVSPSPQTNSFSLSMFHPHLKQTNSFSLSMFHPHLKQTNSFSLSMFHPHLKQTNSFSLSMFHPHLKQTNSFSLSMFHPHLKQTNSFSLSMFHPDLKQTNSFSLSMFHPHLKQTNSFSLSMFHPDLKQTNSFSLSMFHPHLKQTNSFSLSMFHPHLKQTNSFSLSMFHPHLKQTNSFSLSMFHPHLKQTNSFSLSMFHPHLKQTNSFSLSMFHPSPQTNKLIFSLHVSPPRRLYNFPLSLLFQTEEVYYHQSGRILRASWGLCCVAMFASYGALLTSTATAPREYPKITSFVDLLAHAHFKIGLSPQESYTYGSLRNASPGTLLAQLWQVLSEQNRSEPSTFSTDRSYHIRRVLEGDYAYLTNVRKRQLPIYVDGDYSDVNFVSIRMSRLHLSTAKNSFYTSNLERILLSAIETGLITSVDNKNYPPLTRMRISQVENETEVNFCRLEFLIQVASVGICLAFASLAAEKCVSLFRVFLR